MGWEKINEKRVIESYRIGSSFSRGGSHDSFYNLSGGVVGITYPIKKASWRNNSVKIQTSIGRTSGMRASFVRVDSENSPYYLDTLWATFPGDKHPSTLLSWELNPGMGMLDRILHGIKPHHLNAMKNTDHSLSRSDKYTPSCIWNDKFIRQLESLDDVMPVSNIWEAVTQHKK